MPDPTEEKLDALKAYFEQEMPGWSVDSRQTTDSGPDEDCIDNSDFARRCWSFFFHREKRPAIGWDWRIKISMWFLDDYALPRIIKALELNQWKTRLQGAPSGSFFKLDHHGFQGPSADASS